MVAYDVLVVKIFKDVPADESITADMAMHPS
jgi:hypothetical protein